ncbi:MAG: helix-turn-helix domain-containing protein, partial [Sciscionella sp.]
LMTARKAAGLTQEDLAAALRVERSTVVRWEAGQHAPQSYLWPKLAKVLGISRGELGTLLSPPAPGTALALTATAPSVSALPDGGDDIVSIASAAAHESLHFGHRATESNASQDLLEHLRWETSRLAVEYVYMPIPALFRDLVNIRNSIFTLLDTRQRPQHLHELYFLAGTTCLLLAHASQNVGNQRAAVAQLRTAWTCADMADHDALRAWSRGTAALIDEWSMHQSNAVESALQGVRFSASAESHIRLAAIEARAAARMGNGVRAREALDRLHALQDGASGRDDVVDLGGLLSFPKAKQHYYIGSTYGLLGEHERAEQYARTAISSYETGPPAERSYGDETLARLDVVNARLSFGDVAGAAVAAAPLFALPEERRIHQLTTAIDRTRSILEQPQFARSGTSRELLDGLRQYQQAPASSLALRSVE